MPNSNPAFKKSSGDDFVSFNPGQSLPVLSEKTDSLRAYQFEVHFKGLDTFNGTNGPQGLPEDLTLAAKRVSAAGVMVEDIVVDRLNDKLYYPGKFTQDELVILFDNLYKNKAGLQLWRWFENIFDPVTSELVKSVDGGKGGFKINRLEVIQLDNKMKPMLVTEYYGVYPKKFTPGEKNYSTNEMDTVEMTFRFDFMRVGDYKLA